MASPRQVCTVCTTAFFFAVVCTLGASVGDHNHRVQEITDSHLFISNNHLVITHKYDAATKGKTRSSDVSGSVLKRERATETSDSLVLAGRQVPFIFQGKREGISEKTDSLVVSQEKRERVAATTTDSILLANAKDKTKNSRSVNSDNYSMEIQSESPEFSQDQVDPGVLGTTQLGSVARRDVNANQDGKHDPKMRISKPHCFVQSALGVVVTGSACKPLEDKTGCPKPPSLSDPTQEHDYNAYFKIVRRAPRDDLLATKVQQQYESNPRQSAKKMLQNRIRVTMAGDREELRHKDDMATQQDDMASQQEDDKTLLHNLSLTITLPEAVREDVIVWITTYPSGLDDSKQRRKNKNHDDAKFSSLINGISSTNDQWLLSQRGRRGGGGEKGRGEAQLEVIDSRDDNNTTVQFILPSLKQDSYEAASKTGAMKKKTDSSYLPNPAAPVLLAPDRSSSNICWGFVFQRSAGWLGSVLKVEGLPYSTAWYTAHVTAAASTTLLAYTSFDPSTALKVDLEDQEDHSRPLNSRAGPTLPRLNPPPPDYLGTVFRSRSVAGDDEVTVAEDDTSPSPSDTNQPDQTVINNIQKDYTLLKEQLPLLNTESKLNSPKQSIGVLENKVSLNTGSVKLSGSKKQGQVINILYQGTPETGWKQTLQQDRFNQALHSTVDSSYTPQLDPVQPQSSSTSQSSLGSASQTALGDRSRSTRDVSCSNCLRNMTSQHHYNPTTAMLTLAVSYTCSQGCCQGCQARVYILQYQHGVDHTNCSSLRHDHASMSVLNQVAEAGSVSVQEPFHIELRTGCYIAKLEDGGEQLFHGFMWLKPFKEPANLNTWNTTFYLDPRPKLKEVEVRWTEPQYPFNFSRYSLQLWYQENKSLQCSGYHDRSDHLLQVQPTPSLPLDEPRGVFGDLSPGWYCARVTPLDARCPRDGCAVRASHSVRLEAYPPSADEQAQATLTTDEGANVSVTLLAVVLTVTVCLMALVAFVAVKMRLAARQRTRTPDAKRLYRQVRPSECSTGAPKQVLLLAWTTLGDDGGHTARAVHALKRALAAHFSVWDYLDLLSLPVSEREVLLRSPAGWLHSTLHKTAVKVVVVSTPGAGRWQRTVMGEEAPPSPGSVGTPLDALLFPSLLQQILQSPFLVADYSKIFVVRFSAQPTLLSSSAPDDITSSMAPEPGIEGVVQGLLYTLPLHLHTLLLALLGLPNEPSESAALLPYSSDILNAMVPASRPRDCVTQPPGVHDKNHMSTACVDSRDGSSLVLQGPRGAVIPPSERTSRNNVQNAKHCQLNVSLSTSGDDTLSASNGVRNEVSIV